MLIRVLGCSGAISQNCRTTSFLIDDFLLVDAGTGVGDLTLHEMAAIDHVFLTHSHLDHIAALPLMADAVFNLRQSLGKRPLQVYALAETIAALYQHVFNNTIWPDFTKLPTREQPFIELCVIERGQKMALGAHLIEALPANHTVPAVGYAVSANRPGAPAWVYSGDTGPCPAFWARIQNMDVALLVMEAAYNDQEADLAALSQHFHPKALAAELVRSPMQAGSYPIYITHTKPMDTELIMAQIQEQAHPHAIFWLHSGQILRIDDHYA